MTTKFSTAAVAILFTGFSAFAQVTPQVVPTRCYSVLGEPRACEPAGTVRNSTDENGHLHVFTRDVSHPELGDAWSDEHGTIWGDLVRRDWPGCPSYEAGNSDPCFMNLAQATEYCSSRGPGVSLPTREDTTRLKVYLGAHNAMDFEGYEAAALPNLIWMHEGFRIGYLYWTGYSHMFGGGGIVFIGNTGDSTFGDYAEATYGRIAVRCTIPR